MGKKVCIVGGVAGGASVAARVRRLDESAEIIMFERGPHVSFSNCALPYHLSGQIENSEDLVLMDPTVFHEQYRIEARVHSEVIAIDKEKQTLTIKNSETGETYSETYDKLVLSPGANPIKPPLPGIEKPHVFTVRNVVDIEHLNNHVKAEAVEQIVVIGGGFIGIEVAENLVHAGKKVTLVEAQDQVMAPFDVDMAQLIHKEIIDNGMTLILRDGITSVEDHEITLQSGRKVNADAVVMAIGVRPETTLAKDAELDIGVTGGIKVNQHYLTSDPHIYAVGDAIEVHHKLTGQKTRLALAGPAQRQARAAADHMYHIPHRNNGVIGSSAIQVFGLNAASTGLNARMAEQSGFDYDISFVVPADKVGIMPSSNPMFFKLVFEKPTGRILGAQAIGKGNVDKRIDVIATMLTMNGTLEDLKELELCYSPVFGTAKDVVNMAALVGLNILNGEVKHVQFTEVRQLVEDGAFIVDARESDETKYGMIKGAVNIPLSTFRDRLEEIPKDQPVYVHCRSGQRSYNMVRALGQLGFHNVYNIAGSYLAVCHYEYYLDHVESREPIVSRYNFY